MTQHLELHAQHLELHTLYKKPFGVISLSLSPYEARGTVLTNGSSAACFFLS